MRSLDEKQRADVMADVDLAEGNGHGIHSSDRAVDRVRKDHPQKLATVLMPASRPMSDREMPHDDDDGARRGLDYCGNLDKSGNRSRTAQNPTSAYVFPRCAYFGHLSQDITNTTHIHTMVRYLLAVDQSYVLPYPFPMFHMYRGADGGWEMGRGG